MKHWTQIMMAITHRKMIIIVKKKSRKLPLNIRVPLVVPRWLHPEHMGAR